ncbi:hypothetical protein F0562_022180 [Nyssa sinensis]|uniref:Uncharacterized protein n=1 Tax=Nyssa sinensis TaxID=561372 RepID=A0A5J5BNH4_9ASTE|nr:hypothetical protein F0562_022180 [Nyssa sinensis]
MERALFCDASDVGRFGTVNVMPGQLSHYDELRYLSTTTTDDGDAWYDDDGANEDNDSCCSEEFCNDGDHFSG